MMPNDVWHRKTSIFSDSDSVIKEERERRRILRIQQVRLQSKKIASQVIEKSKLLKKCEEKKQTEIKEKALNSWKRDKFRDLENELSHGLQCYGESYNAVGKELEDQEAKKAKQQENVRVARERGSVAFSIDFAEREDINSQQEELKSHRKNIRLEEDQRAKAIANLPPCIKPPAEEEKSCKSEGTKVEVYDFSLPQHRRHVHFTTVPDDTVKKIDPKVCTASAKEEAVKEIKAKEKKIKEDNKTKELTAWLGNTAETRKVLEKEYKSIFGSLKELEREEFANRPSEALSISDLNRLELRLIKKKEGFVKSVKVLPKNMADDRKENNTSPQPMDFTEYPGTQFTPEEVGALGATAQSLQALLDNLAGESRRRLEEVVGDEYFYFSDDDFATPPPHSPDGLSVTVEASSKMQVCSGAGAVVLSSSEVSVKVGKHKKKKKKKNKRKHDMPDGPVSGDADKPQQSTNSTQYMSPPEHLQEDKIANYLANIEHEKAQLQRAMEAPNSDVSSIDVQFYVNKLLAMSRDGVENLSVGGFLSESSTDQQVPSKKKQRKSSSLSAADTSDERDGNLTNGQPSGHMEMSSYKEASTEYLSLHELKSKDPTDARVQPGPQNQDLLNLIGPHAEPLVRPMENLRLSTIIEGDSSVVSSANSENTVDGKTLDIESELMKRGLPMPAAHNTFEGSAINMSDDTGEEYLRKFLRLPKPDTPVDMDRPGNVLHSTPVFSGSEGGNDRFENGLSPTSPIVSSESDKDSNDRTLT